MRVSTRRGSLTMPAQVDPKLMTGHVWMPNGFGMVSSDGMVNGAARFTLAWSHISYWFDSKIVDGLVNLAGLVGRSVSFVSGLFDRLVVDGLVNGVGIALAETASGLRLIQTGRVQTYLYGALAGGLAVILLNFLIH